jgi:hypothetical protein
MEHNCHSLAFKPSSTRAGDFRPGWYAAILIGTLAASVPALAQQKSGPGITDDDSLTWHGITLYGVVDLGYQFFSELGRLWN